MGYKGRLVFSAGYKHLNSAIEEAQKCIRAKNEFTGFDIITEHILILGFGKGRYIENDTTRLLFTTEFGYMLASYNTSCLTSTKEEENISKIYSMEEQSKHAENSTTYFSDSPKNTSNNTEPNIKPSMTSQELSQKALQSFEDAMSHLMKTKK